MAIKTEHVLWGVALGGFGLIGTWLLYSEYEKNKHIDEFIDKVKKAENAYQNAIAAGNIEEAQSIAQFYESLMHEEEAVINAEGGNERLIRRVTELIGVFFAGAISYKVITYLMKKYPPNNYQPPTPPTQPVLAAIAAGESAFRKFSRYLKGLLNSFAEVAEYMTEESWNGLPNWVIIALALAAAIIIALTFGLGTGALVPIAAMAI